MRTRVTVEDLQDQTLKTGPHPHLHCFKCGAQYSANRGDYFMHPKDHVFKCCRRNMTLVITRVVLEVVPIRSRRQAKAKETTP